MIHIDDPFAPSGADHVAQQRFAVLYRAASQVVAIEVQQVEGEIGEPVGAALGYGLGQRVNVRDATVIGYRNSPSRTIEGCPASGRKGSRNSAVRS